MKTKEDFLLAAASLFIAFLLWFSTQPLFEPGKQLEFAVTLRYEGLDEEELIALTPPEPVMVVASGNAVDLDKVDTDNIEAVVDLSEARTGTSRYPIDLYGLTVPSVTLEAKKSVIEIEIEEVQRKVLPVQVNPTGATPSELTYSGSETAPVSVEVYGPASGLGKVATLQVTLPLSSVTSGTTVELPVEVLDEDGKAVPSMMTNPSMVTVIPKTQVAPASKSVPINLNWNGTVPQGYRVESIELVPDQVNLTGASAQISMVGGLETEEINLGNRTSDFSQKVKLVIPTGVSASIQEVEIRVKIVRSGRG